VRVTGDRSDPVFNGYTCVKGRAQPEYLNSPDRLLRSIKKGRDGIFAPIPFGHAVEEIAGVLRRLLDDHGPRSIASYSGTMAVTGAAVKPFVGAFMDAIDSPMRFTAETIDKPGKPIAKAILGDWMAPPYDFHDPEVAVFVGLNPLVAYQGIPSGHPGKWLRAATDRGLKLIVIDPRRTEIARRAFLHLQPRPGHDAEILAGMLRVVLEEDLRTSTPTTWCWQRERSGRLVVDTSWWEPDPSCQLPVRSSTT
jgi:anaerobic selenocysteine-containing dehydrogenase